MTPRHDSGQPDWRREVLSFWFGLRPEQWWTSDPAVDEDVRERCLKLWELKRQLPADLALAVAKQAVELGFDDQLQTEERGFLYMPFMHSEALADQKRSVQLFTALGDDNQLGFARKHHDVIERFGRFPHRNAILGRAPRPAEVAAGDVVPW